MLTRFNTCDNAAHGLTVISSPSLAVSADTRGLAAYGQRLPQFSPFLRITAHGAS